MKNSILMGISGALITGMIISIQATLSSRGGSIIGPIRTGLITNIGSGLFALLILGITLVWRVLEWRNLPAPTIGMLIFSGGLGILVVIGVSFSLRYTGVTAGSAALIMGQLLISMVVDGLGWSGQEAIPVTWQRILGLLMMGVAVYLFLPKD